MNTYRVVNYPNNYPVSPLNNDRYFLLPFLGGALVGGAAVGLTRPRPIYNVAPNGGGPMPGGPNGIGGPNFNPYLPYGNYSYSYYYPTRPF